MTKKDKQELIAQVVALLNELIEAAEEDVKPVPETSAPVEMLTIKECTEAVKGLSEHTVRQLVNQDKISYIRTGQGINGKILINKSALLNYLNASEQANWKNILLYIVWQMTPAYF